MVLNVAAPTVKTMSSCRATSFYLAPGVAKYFKDHTVAAVLPDGQWAAIQHRGDIARLKQEHPTWDGTVLCGPRYQDGLRGLRRNISTDGGLVEIWNVDERTIEGRRPLGAAVYALHKWAIAGDAQAVGGVRQLVETVAPGAPKSVRNALEAAVLRGEHHAVDVVAAAWRAELLRNPDQIVELLRTARIPFRSVPEARLEQMLRAVVGPGRSVDAQVLISNMINGSGMLDAGTKRLLALSSTSPAILKLLAMESTPDIRQLVAENPNTSVAVIEQLAKDEDAYVRSDVARNLNTPVTILEQLAKDDDSRVRRGVAENPSTPVSILEQFSHYLDEDFFIMDDALVETGVAQNPNTPASVLEWLSEYKYEDLKYSVARHSNTPVETLEQLAKDADKYAHSAVAENPNTPVAVLEQLATSAWDADGIPERDGDRYGGARSAVARNPNTPVTILEQLAKDEDEYVRGAVGQNPNTPVAALEQLAKDEDAYVRRYVAGNLNTPVTILEQLSKDDDMRVRSATEHSQSTPVERLAGTTLARRSGVHDDQYEYHAIENGIPFELRTTSDLAYNALVQYGAPAADYPATISDVSELGRAGVPFGFPDDTLKLRHTLAESTVRINDIVLTPRVVSSPRALTENANYMGNCTAGYEHHIRDNESLIIALDDKTTPQGATVYNVEIQRGESGRWDTIGEINSRFNSGVSDAEYRTIEAQVAELLQ